MSEQFPRKDIKDLVEANKEHVEVSQLFKIKDLSLKTGKKGPYLEFTLGDKTGEMRFCKKWDSSEADLEVLKKLATPLVFITGKTSIFNGKLHVKADSIAIPDDLPPEAINDFMISSPFDLKDLKKRLWNFIQSMKNPYVKQLCEITLQDPEVKENLPYAFAAVNNHHNYRSGLITHIVNLMESAEALIERYERFPYPPDKPYKINRDIMLALCFFHDLFKFRNYTLTGDYVDTLTTHLPYGALYIREKSAQVPNFPTDLRDQLEHGVLSHHGTLEWGSPDVPLTVEAMLFHHLDNMASKVEPMMEAICALPAGANFTDRLNSTKTKAHRGGSIFTD